MGRRAQAGTAAAAMAAVVVITPAVGLAALPKPGTFSGGCPGSACTLSLKTGQHKITNLSYDSSNCGGVGDSTVSIKISKKGSFSYAPPPPAESFAISVVLKGRFDSSTKAKGTITVLNYEQGHSKPTCQQTGNFTVKLSKA